MQVFVDLDGVLADFDTGYRQRCGPFGGIAADDVSWTQVEACEDFYATLPPMPDLDVLWDGLAPYTPIILTGLPKSIPEALDQKRQWVTRHLGPTIQVIGCWSREKCRYGKPGDVLIDDWEKYRHLWIRMGGHWITHRSARDSLEALRQHHGKEVSDAH